MTSLAQAKCNGCDKILTAKPGERNACEPCWVKYGITNAVECDAEMPDRHVFIGNVTPL